MVRFPAIYRAVFTVSITASLWIAAADAADPVAGNAAYAICAACHGPQGEGNQALGAPRLAGQEPWYLERQMHAFQLGWRGTRGGDSYGMQMRPMALAVTDPTELQSLIGYIGTLPDVPAAPVVEGDAAAGAQAYTVCAACHGSRAEGSEPMGGPRLAGQSDWYLVRQIQNYQQDLRGYHPKDIFGQQMKPMASTLNGEQAINDLVAYLNTLR